MNDLSNIEMLSLYWKHERSDDPLRVSVGDSERYVITLKVRINSGEATLIKDWKKNRTTENVYKFRATQDLIDILLNDISLDKEGKIVAGLLKICESKQHTHKLVSLDDVLAVISILSG